jgi:hypothetical protein
MGDLICFDDFKERGDKKKFAKSIEAPETIVSLLIRDGKSDEEVRFFSFTTTEDIGETNRYEFIFYAIIIKEDSACFYAYDTETSKFYAEWVSVFLDKIQLEAILDSAITQISVGWSNGKEIETKYLIQNAWSGRNE